MTESPPKPSVSNSVSGPAFETSKALGPLDQSTHEIRPIFVVGCGRSGTTLLAVLLDRHSQIAMTPETHFYDRFFRRYGYDQTLDTHEKLIAALDREPRFHDMKLDTAQVLERFRLYPCDCKHLFLALLEEYGHKHNKPRVGEKTPDHLEFIPKIVEWFPSARIICIMRDGRDVAQSFMQVHWTRKHKRLQGMVWRWCAKTCLEYLKRFPDHMIYVRLEDLLREPSSVMSRIADFVGVTFEATQLQAQTHTSVVLEHETQWMGKARQELDPSRIAAWTRKTSPQEKWMMNSMMGVYLRHFNYPDAGMDGCPLHLRAWHFIANFWCRLRHWGPVDQLWRTVGKKLSSHNEK